MSRLFILLTGILSLFGLIAFLAIRQNNNAEIRAQISVAEAMTNENTEGYARAIQQRRFRFPHDHGPHPEFRTEWWYLTGNLKADNDQKFGFQFTIFRNSLSPNQADRESDWATNQVYMGHFALTDVKNQRFYAFERFARGAQGLAGAKRNPLRISIEDWYITYEIMDEENLDTIRLEAAKGNIALELTLRNMKPIVLNGENGLSQKGAEPGNASYYYSMTRLKCHGEIMIEDKAHAVSGNAWLDREWSTSALAQNQVGWDWFSLQLDNNTELMYYQIRRKDGTPDPFSKGTLIDKKGNYETISLKDVNLNVLDFWVSPLGGRYPAGWQLELSDKNIMLNINPVMQNQELNVSVRYWEGAVTVEGHYNGESVEGMGYVELTGYVNRGIQ